MALESDFLDERIRLASSAAGYLRKRINELDKALANPNTPDGIRPALEEERTEIVTMVKHLCKQLGL